jgi:hypothetical protein
MVMAGLVPATPLSDAGARPVGCAKARLRRAHAVIVMIDSMIRVRKASLCTPYG